MVARRRKVILGALVGVPWLAYTIISSVMWLEQREMLYRSDAASASGGAIASPITPAVPGSEPVTLHTADGETLAAWYVPPQPGKHVILFLHGQGGRLALQTNRWRHIREAGLGVLAFSYRGFAGSTGTPTEWGLRLDALAAYRWLRQRFEPSQIVIHGQSLGTGVAVRLASEVEAGAVILEAPFVSAVDVAAERYPWLPVRALMLDQFHSDERIGKIKAPILIAHGDRDSIIPFEQGKRLFELAHEPKTFVRMPGSEHNTLVRDGLYDRIVPFLAGLR